MAMRPRFGGFGLLALPYFLLFELLGPVVEVGALVLLPLGWALGLLNVSVMVAFFVTSVVLGVVLSVAALALEEFSFRRHERHRDVGRMLAFAVLENFGFRQLTSVWRLLGLADLGRRKAGWGVMERRGLSARPLLTDIRR
jgi:hypothetical protein